MSLIFIKISREQSAFMMTYTYVAKKFLTKRGQEAKKEACILKNISHQGRRFHITCQYTCVCMHTEL